MSNGQQATMNNVQAIATPKVMVFVVGSCRKKIYAAGGEFVKGRNAARASVF